MKSAIWTLCCVVVLHALPLGAILVFVGPTPQGAKRFEVALQMSVTAFLAQMREAGFESKTLRFKNRELVSYPEELSLDDLNVREGAWFFAQDLREPAEAMKARLSSLVYGDVDNPEKISETLRDLTNEAAVKLLCSVRADEKDGAKNILFLAARKGNLKTILFIREFVGESSFNDLLTERTPQGRTVLHAAARATKNAPDLIRFILKLAPDLRTKTNEFGCTALDAAMMYGQKEPERLAALAGFASADEPEFKKMKLVYSEACKPK